MDHSSSDGSPHANFKGVLRHETCQVDGRQNRIDTHLNEVRKLWLSLEAKNSRFGGGGGKGRVMWQIRVGGWRWMRNEASGYEMASMINQNDSLYVSRKNVQSRRFYTQLYKWVPVNCQWRLMKCWGRGGEGGGEGGREGGGESKPQWNGNH